MDLFLDQKYKDELPLSTITNIRNILANLNILVIESGWQNSADGFYSVNLKIANTSITTNGKGTTYHYALASGYGELLERLQNQSFFRLNSDYSLVTYEYKGFYYAPDEMVVTLEELLNIKEEWITKQFESIKDIDKKTLLEKWEKVSYEKVPSDFVTLPYVNLLNNKISNIPIKMIAKMYMSNGMCGGNTYEEAIVQGLSEVFERHVNKEILLKKITPPTIPRSYLSKYPKINNMITQIENSGNYELIVKDCSLNEGYPVVGAIYINKSDQTYFVKFGSHPKFEIAIERTLTELLQGQDIRNMLGVKEYSYQSKIESEYNNLIGILVNGSGYYPPEFFSPEGSYDFKDFEDIKINNNKDMLRYYINFLRDKDYDCFVRDVSFLGFPSFHVIVSGISEIDEFNNIKAIDDYVEYNKIKKIIRDINNASEGDIDKVFNFFQENNYNSGASIVQFLNLPTKNIFPWYYTSIDLFLAALYYKNREYKKAAVAIDKFIDFMQTNTSNSLQRTFFSCARDYIAALGDGLNEQEIASHLGVFYSVAVIQGVISDFSNPDEIMKYGEIKCFNCNECLLQQQCHYCQNEKVYLTLKDHYCNNPIKQENLIKNLNWLQDK